MRRRTGQNDFLSIFFQVQQVCVKLGTSCVGFSLLVRKNKKFNLFKEKLLAYFSEN